MQHRRLRHHQLCRPVPVYHLPRTRRRAGTVPKPLLAVLNADLMRRAAMGSKAAHTAPLVALPPPTAGSTQPQQAKMTTSCLLAAVVLTAALLAVVHSADAGRVQRTRYVQGVSQMYFPRFHIRTDGRPGWAITDMRCTTHGGVPVQLLPCPNSAAATCYMVANAVRAACRCRILRAVVCSGHSALPAVPRCIAVLRTTSDCHMLGLL